VLFNKLTKKVMILFYMLSVSVWQRDSTRSVSLTNWFNSKLAQCLHLAVQIFLWFLSSLASCKTVLQSNGRTQGRWNTFYLVSDRCRAFTLVWGPGRSVASENGHSTGSPPACVCVCVCVLFIIINISHILYGGRCRHPTEPSPLCVPFYKPTNCSCLAAL